MGKRPALGFEERAGIGSGAVEFVAVNQPTVPEDASEVAKADAGAARIGGAVVLDLDGSEVGDVGLHDGKGSRVRVRPSVGLGAPSSQEPTPSAVLGAGGIRPPSVWGSILPAPEAFAAVIAAHGFVQLRCGEGAHNVPTIAGAGSRDALNLPTAARRAQGAPVIGSCEPIVSPRPSVGGAGKVGGHRSRRAGADADTGGPVAGAPPVLGGDAAKREGASVHGEIGVEHR